MTPAFLRATIAALAVLFAASVNAAQQSSGDAIVGGQLVVASDGPVVATFLGASEPFVWVQMGWTATNTLFSWAVAPLFSSGATPGATMTVDPLGTIVGGGQAVDYFPAGTDVFFIAGFGQDGNVTRASSTGRVAPLDEFGPSLGIQHDAAVLATSGNQVLIGFNAGPAGSMPGSFGSYGLRISVSNVCMRN